MTKKHQIKRQRNKSQSIQRAQSALGGQCQEFINIISDFVDLELTESHSIKIREHLSTCLHCTQVYRDVRVIIQLCRSESTAEPPKVSSRLWQVLQQRFKKMDFKPKNNAR
jgi:predicted anti-sigma-YlaC factor YlaD